MDGWITIGTELSTDKFDKQILDLEKKMKKEEDKKILIDTKLSNQEQELEKARQKTDELAEAYQRLKTVQEQVANGKATPAQFTTMQELENTYGTLENINNSFERALSKQDAIELKVAQTRARYEEINARVSEYKSKIENVKIQKQVAEVQKLKDGFNNVGSSIQSAITRVGKLALGIFGIRTAITALRRASSDLANYDKQYAINLEYIRFVLTQAIAPVLRWIVEMTMKLLGYINMIAQAWFGINLFSSGSAENFNKMKASAGGVSKAVKQIKKDLLGFDEINVLTDQSDTGTSAGAGGVGIPSLDISNFEGEKPKWLQWIIDNKDNIIGIILGIAGALTALKLSNLLKSLGLIKKGLKGIQVLGIALMIWGIVKAVIALIDYLKNPSWENFGKFIEGIGIAIIGLGAIIGSLPVAIAGAIVLIVGIIVKYWEQIKGFLQKGINWLSSKSEWVRKIFGNKIGNIYDMFVNTLQALLDWFDLVFTNIKKIFDGFITFFKGVFTGNWKQAWEGIKQIFFGVWDIIKGTLQIIWDWLNKTVIQPIWNGFNSLFNNTKNGTINLWNGIKNVLSSVGNWIYNTVIQPVYNFIINLYANIKNNAINLWNGIKNIFSTIGNWVYSSIVQPVINSISSMWSNLKNGAVSAWNGIKSVFSNVASFFKNIFSNAWSSVKNVFSSGGQIFDGIKEGIVSSFKNIVNKLIIGINKVIYKPFNKINEALRSIRNVEIFGAKPFGSIPTISIPQIPYLKVGGIINMPNKGTMIGGSAIGGEAGKEGVIPLTDQQAMAELGREIGKNVLVNLTNITSMNGRVISRELKNIQSEQDFAYNV